MAVFNEVKLNFVIIFSNNKLSSYIYTKITTMTFDEFKEHLETKTFLEIGSNIIYTFSDDTIKVNYDFRCRWELKEEDGRFYIETIPSIQGEKYKLMWIDFEQGNSLKLHLTSKMTDESYTNLEEIKNSP